MKNVVLRSPSADEECKLKELWSAIFSDIGMEDFFENLYNKSLCSAMFEDDKLCAMAFLIRAGELSYGEKLFNAAMIYSVATSPEHRGKGYAKAVVDELVDKAFSTGYSVALLSPSDDGLFEFYNKKNEFIDYFYVNEQSYNKEELSALPCKDAATESLERVSAENYVTLRESLLGKSTHIKQDVRIFRYQQSICDEVGGGLYRVRDSCAVIEIQDDSSVFIKELLSPSDNVSEILSIITNKYPSHKYVVRTPVCSEISDKLYHINIKRFGMIKADKGVFLHGNLHEFEPWYGLALD
ncbi:MAG: GNAT family N-acetyltransferase [Oscillospiraceae bacterium]|nr:GNAT family N-acetyltransferase [Oscillospiraceae bacterium]